MPHRPFTRAQTRQNARFLKALARTGNARLAAEQLGVHRSTYTKRRARCSRFAALWDAALAVAHASLKDPPRDFSGRGTTRRVVEGPGAQRPENSPRTRGGLVRRSSAPRCEGGEPILVRLKSGRVQLRRAPKGRMTKAAEQAFLRALAATCNVRLSAAAAGFTHSAFYQRRKKDPGFAREWRLARAEGHQRLECALLAGLEPESHEDDSWRHNDPLPIPPMTADQAIQLFAMHRRRVDHGDIPDPMRRRPGESREAVSMRLSLLYQARLERDREAYRVAEAARNEPDDEEEDGEDIAALPALEQVTGWSKADQKKKVHNADKAMFGGWRIADWKPDKA